MIFSITSILYVGSISLILLIIVLDKAVIFVVFNEVITYLRINNKRKTRTIPKDPSNTVETLNKAFTIETKAVGYLKILTLC